MKTTGDPIAKALGATRTVLLHFDASGGPLSWLQMREVVSHRLAAGGGNEQVPDWDSQRLIPCRQQSWRRLVRLADWFREEGMSLSPNELASILLERQIESLQSLVETT